MVEKSVVDTILSKVTSIENNNRMNHILGSVDISS